MKQVCRAIVGTGFSEDFSNKSVTFGILSLFGQQLCALHFKLKMLVSPFALAGIVHKLIQDVKGRVRPAVIFISCQKHIFRLNLSQGVGFKSFKPFGKRHQFTTLILSRPEQDARPQCLNHD